MIRIEAVDGPPRSISQSPSPVSRPPDALTRSGRRPHVECSRIFPPRISDGADYATPLQMRAPLRHPRASAQEPRQLSLLEDSQRKLSCLLTDACARPPASPRGYAGQASPRRSHGAREVAPTTAAGGAVAPARIPHTASRRCGRLKQKGILCVRFLEDSVARLSRVVA